MIPTKYINAGPMQAQASAGAAMAPGQALAQVGGAISQVGEMGLEMAGKIREVKEAGTINAFMADADKQASDFSISLSKRSDTDKWSQEWQDKSGAIRESAKAQGLSESGMAKLDSQLTNWSSQHAIHFNTQAATTGLGIAKSQTTQSLEYYAARGDFNGFDRTLQTAVEGGILNPAEVERAKMHRNSEAASMDIQRMAEGNPESMVDFPEEEILRRLPGATPEMVQRGKHMAKGIVRERALALSDTAMDDVFSEKLKTPEMVDQDPRFEKMRPTMKQKVKDAVRQFQGDKASDFMASPDEQARVVGNVSKLISGWDPKSKDLADETSVQIQSEIARLPKGSAIRDELTRQAQAVRADTWAASTSHGDAAMKAIDAAGKAGRFGKIPDGPEPQSVKRLLDAGFLSNQDNLKANGLSPEAAAKVSTAGDDAKTPADKHAAQLKALRELAPYWGQRGTPTASKFNQDAMEAMMNYKTEVKSFSPEAEAAATSAQLAVEHKIGEAKMKLADFLKTNPKASAAEIDDKILEIGGEQTQRELKSGIYDGKTSSTSGVSIKLSNYGYASDTTPDTNSANGIGHANNQLEDGKSAAISKSLADRLNLKTGDMVELQTTKGTFQVRYDDTVPSTDSRTGDLPETVDIYRKDGSNGWGGKITKITKI
jgi:hypothetical protein